MGGRFGGNEEAPTTVEVDSNATAAGGGDDASGATRFLVGSRRFLQTLSGIGLKGGAWKRRKTFQIKGLI